MSIIIIGTILCIPYDISGDCVYQLLFYRLSPIFLEIFGAITYIP